MDSSHCQQNILYSRLFKIKTYLINFKPRNLHVKPRPCQNISKVQCNGALLCRIAENFNWSSVLSLSKIEHWDFIGLPQ